MDDLLLESDSDIVKEYFSLLRKYIEFSNENEIIPFENLSEEIKEKFEVLERKLDKIWWSMTLPEMDRANEIQIEYNEKENDT